MLIHMTPSEVGGLQALAMAHGGSLTINPKTGLPEAGILESILPTILGVVLTPFLGPIGAGLAVGGGTALATGDIGKGLAAGLGAWGGGGLGEAMGAAGAASNVAAGTLPAAGTAATQLGALQAGQAGLAAANTAATTAATTAAGDIAAQTAARAAADAAAKQVAQQALTYQSALPITQQFANMGSGLGALGDQASRNIFMNNIGGAGGLMKSVMGATAPAAAQPPEPIKLSEEEKSNYTGPHYPTERIVTYPTAGYNSSREWSYFSPSNPMPYASGGGVGRFLQGSGDGASDSIAASINGNQPARLADGEFVVDARTVSEIGNGSSNAGAKKLYAMMDRVHSARRDARRGQDSDADRYLPA